MVDSPAKCRVIQRRPAGVIGQGVKAVVGIPFGDNIFNFFQIHQQAGLDDIPGAVALALFNRCRHGIVAAVDHPNDTVDFRGTEVFLEGTHFQLTAAGPVVKLKRAAADGLFIGKVQRIADTDLVGDILPDMFGEDKNGPQQIGEKREHKDPLVSSEGRIFRKSSPSPDA